ncbi:hypothetical protein ABEV38_08930, partial [Parageobacillus thermoglucosidasius]
IIPPAKGAGVAGKAAIKGAKAAGIAAEVSKWISKTKNVLNVNKIKGDLQTIYHQVIKGPITETIRSFKKQWENFLENVGSVLHLQGSRLAAAGVGAVSRGLRIGIAEESINMFRHFMIKKSDEAIEGMVKAEPSRVVNVLANFQSKKFVVDNQTFLLDKRG